MNTIVETKPLRGRRRLPRSTPIPITINAPNETIKITNRQRRMRKKTNKALGDKMTTDMRKLMLEAKYIPNTNAGIDFIKAAMNPCGDDPLSNLEGIPDGSGTSLCLLKLRDDMIIAPPTFYEEQDPPIAPDTPWTCVIFSTPYFMSQLIIIRFPENAPPNTTQLRGAINAMTAAEWSSAFYPSFYFPSSFLNDLGFVTAYDGPPFELTVLRPASFNNFSALNTSSGWSYFRKWRTTYKGHTVHLNAPALANQGRVISAATATESSVKNILNQGVVANINDVTAARYSVTPPFQDNILAMTDTQAYQDLAKKGVYCIHRHWNKAIIWNEAEDVRPIWRAASAAQTDISVSVPNLDYLKFDGFDLNLGWVVDQFRGLSTQASLHIKHRVGIEVNVPGTSPWAPFLQSSLLEDDGAWNLYFHLSTTLPHAYESSYNDMGFLTNILGKAINLFSGPLKGAIKVGANVLRGFIGTGEEYLNDKVGSTARQQRAAYGDRGFNRM
jgi:hypothetical protein